MKTTTRDSNMELCRIVAMSMICIFHMIYHGIDEATMNHHNSLILLKNMLVDGSNIYFLISGYFLIKLNIRKFINFISVIFIFGFINYLALMFTGGRHIHVAIFDILFFPVSKSPYWFLMIYMFLMILSPIINKGLKCFGIKSLRIQIVILTLAVFYCCSLGNNISGSNQISLLRGIYYYILGYWLRHDNAIHNIIENKVSVILLICVIIAGSYTASNLSLLTNQASWAAYNSIFIIITALSLFMIFMKYKFKNRVVNFIASASLYVYLIQDGSFGFNYFYGWQQVFVSGHGLWQIILLFSMLFVAYWLLAVASMVIMKRILAVENNLISRFIPYADKKLE